MNVYRIQSPVIWRHPEFKLSVSTYKYKLITALKSDYVIKKVVKLSMKLLFQKQYRHSCERGTIVRLPFRSWKAVGFVSWNLYLNFGYGRMVPL